MIRPAAPDAVEHPTDRAAAVKGLVEETYGFRPSAHTARSFTAALRSALLETGTATVQELHDLLVTPDGLGALDTLAGRLTVGETHFFRVAPQIRMLREVIIPALIAGRTGKRRLRIWSAGCATGEEPYTLALLLRERAPELAGWDVQIIATDVNRAALAIAQEGLYHEWSFRGTPTEVRDRHFTIEGDRWRLAPDVRDMVRFEYLNLAAPAPTPRSLVRTDLDLIICRNVTIYLLAPVTGQLYRHFGEILAPDGWLVLGPADPAPAEQAGFRAVSHRGAVVWQPNPARPAAARWGVPASAATDNRPKEARRPGQLPPFDAPASRRSAPSMPGRAPRRSSRATGGPDGTTAASGVATNLDATHALLRDGDRAAARAEAESLASERRVDPAVHLLLGMLCLEDGALEAALDALRRATFLAPNDPLAQFALGRALARSGEPVRARAAFLQARRALVAMPRSDGLSTPEPVQISELRDAVDVELRSSEASID
jgi:chemotaxis protein methyltransferase CheR